MHAILIYICFEERLVTHHHTATNLLLHNESFVDFQSGLTKGGLISEVILTLVPLPTKGVKSLFLTENLNVLPITVNNLFKFSARKSDLAPFVGNGTKVKTSSEIKPPLYKQS